MEIPAFALASPDERSQVLWKTMEERGYVLLDEGDIDSTPAIRDHIQSTYFEGDFLEEDVAEVHPDRQRARDVVRYRWSDMGLILSENDSVSIRGRSGYAGERIPNRVLTLSDRVLVRWIEAVLALIPPSSRYASGTFGINFFRTRTSVVSGPHRDEERMCFVYVVGKVGGGAETLLYSAADPACIALRANLEPGNMLLFDDARFLHDVTPLVAGADGSQRDVLVCTIDYPETYAESV